MDLMAFLASEGWTVSGKLALPGQTGEAFSPAGLDLCPATRAFLSHYPAGIYDHQKQALAAFVDGHDMCLTTGTASGKSLVFYASAIELLTKKPSSCVIAIYPLKALGREQEERWQQALARAGLDVRVGRIDGQVPTNSRLGIVRDSRVLIVTPDILHAWLLSNLSQSAIRTLLRHLALVIVDEVHSYKGVFGSNAAFLFRRIQHLMALTRARARYISASATIDEPEDHLRKLFGTGFQIIGPDLDTSPRFPVDIELVTPPQSQDLLTSVSQLLLSLGNQQGARFLAFVDSRKQAEHLATIVARPQETDEETECGIEADLLKRLHVLPFRAGYEEKDRDQIQNRLGDGSLRGVVSTSALELGLDIPNLNTGVLVGVPRSSTSLWQRIGRIGRHSPGRVLVVNTRNVYDQAIFRDPPSLLQRPKSQGALYLQNRRIQYIHALCLARQGGEHDQMRAAIRQADDTALPMLADWPSGFMDLCAQERVGEVPIDLQNLKLEAGDDPNHTFPLRDVERQFQVEMRSGWDLQRLGSLSHGQLMREGYPGAVYYYITQAYRVFRVNVHSHEVQVRPEKRYTTRPAALPTLIYPNLSDGNVFQCRRHGDLVVLECNVQAREVVCGYKERRGPNEFSVEYPADLSRSGVDFNRPSFSRTYFTTGVILTHPCLGGERVNAELLGRLLYEAFLMILPFERQDIDAARDKHRTSHGPIQKDTPFVAVFDQTYGSLRLSGRLMESDFLQRTLAAACQIARQEGSVDTEEESFLATPETVRALEALHWSSLEGGQDFRLSGSFSSSPRAACVRIVLPGSKGLNLHRNNEEFEVEAVFFHPGTGSPRYRGKNFSTRDDGVTKDIIALDVLQEIPGESQMGWYDPETGEVIPD